MAEVLAAERAQPSNLRLWFGVLGGVVAWKLQLMANYALVPYACWQGLTGLIHLASAATAGLALGAAWVALQNWRRTGRGFEMETEPLWSRSRFLAVSGMALGLYFALLILGQWLPNLLLGPCDGIA